MRSWAASNRVINARSETAHRVVEKKEKKKEEASMKEERRRKKKKKKRSGPCANNLS